MNLEQMIPTLGVSGLQRSLDQGQWHVDHGSLERFPNFLQPDDGALSHIGKLGQWRHFDIGYRDALGKYHQMNGSGNSASAYYDMGALVRSTSIEEMSVDAQRWLNDWSATLGVARRDLRLNSWAVRGANGIHWHFDPEDVIHFQIKGDKLLKFLPTEYTRNADTIAKRQEHFMTPVQDFSQAHSEIVREGTITIIPRGVWHWSESQSKESFAVAMCINPPSQAQNCTEALYKRLRLMEENRRPLRGSPEEQQAAMETCLQDARRLLDEMTAENLLIEDRRNFLSHQVDGFYFYSSPQARIDFTSLRLYLNNQPLALQADEVQLCLLKQICTMARGFYAEQWLQTLSEEEKCAAREILTTLAKAGFLNFMALRKKQ